MSFFEVSDPYQTNIRTARYVCLIYLVKLDRFTPSRVVCEAIQNRCWVLSASLLPAMCVKREEVIRGDPSMNDNYSRRGEDRLSGLRASQWQFSVNLSWNLGRTSVECSRD